MADTFNLSPRAPITDPKTGLPTQQFVRAWNLLAAAAAQVPSGSTSYTPAVWATTGSMTASATGYSFQIGKQVFVEIVLTITTASGATFPKVALPVAAKDLGTALHGRSSSGKTVVGMATADTSTVTIFNYDGTNPAADGAVITLSGSYVAA